MPGPMRSEFSDPEHVAVPHPEPEVWNRLATKDEIPGGARALMNAARKAGWPNVFATYARGYVKHATQDSFILKHSVVVRIGNGVGVDIQAVAIYTAPVNRPDHEPARYGHAGVLTQLLAAHEPPKYTCEAMRVRGWVPRFSSREFKAWLRFTPEPRTSK